MSFIYKLIISLSLLIVLGGLGFAYGYYSASNKEEITVTSNTILERISDKYFIVTKTLLLDEKTSITVDKGSDWSNLLWGQEIDAEATISIDVGVDLSDLSEEDISIDTSTKKIEIKVPHASILNSSIQGDFDVESTDGILKKIFKNTTNKDYNAAIATMKDQAEMKVKNNTELLADAERNALTLLEMILDNLGYELTFVFKE